ncbi:hypothetical protein CEXT_70841 [Caerostris extrusa]|uniref:Uncharacterized protein n=1 Tax=Caerostris extrusa TaxID=172846 RepID=A0AAV4RFP3_CAEEX|nr:hypothetical protein CEXT_70841 [Caerostris extrusa]
MDHFGYLPDSELSMDSESQEDHADVTVAAPPKLPPIMVRYKDELKDKIAEISNQHKEDIRIKLPASSLKSSQQTLMCTEPSPDISRNNSSNTTSSLINQRPLKAVLKGLPPSALRRGSVIAHEVLPRRDYC